MKIIRHGKLMYFRCEECECEWLASKKECREVTYSGSVPRYTYNCPDCGANAEGKEAKIGQTKAVDFV